MIDGEEMIFSQNYACIDCGIGIEELEPRMFSFNSPFGACPTCDGLGVQMKIDPDLVIPNRRLTINEGAIRASGWSVFDGTTIASMYFTALAKRYGFTLDTPVKDLPEEIVQILLYGNNGEKLTLEYNRNYGSGVYHNDYEGIIPNMERRYRSPPATGAKWRSKATCAPPLAPPAMATG